MMYAILIEYPSGVKGFASIDGHDSRLTADKDLADNIQQELTNNFGNDYDPPIVYTVLPVALS